MIRPVLAAILALASLAVPCSPAAAMPCRGGDADPAYADRVDEASAAERSQATPRDALAAFLQMAEEGDWGDAGRMLRRPEAGWPGGASPERLARALSRLIDQRQWVSLARVPAEEANRAGAPDALVAASVETRAGVFELSMVRADGKWWIAPATVESVPAAARAAGVWWASSMPWFLTDVRLAEIELWQWAGIAVIAMIGIALGWLVSRAIRRGAHITSMRRFGPVARSVVAVSAPLGVLVSLLGMRLAQPLLVLSAPARENLALGSRAITVFAIAWAVARWLRIVTSAVEEQMERRGIADATSIVRVGRAVATALVWLLGVAGALQIFGLDLSAVIAGLGIGTAAIALASQQTLANLFGGASLVADRVLQPGDQVTVNGVTGTVERIGIRSTHLRTLDRTLVVVANGDLAQSRIEKLTGRDGFRYATTIGLEYSTPPAAVRAILRELRARLEAEPTIERQTLMVNFMAFGASSLDIDVRATFLTEDMDAYRAAVERVNLDFMEIVERNGSGFAFPSRTVYVKDGAEPDDRAAAVRRAAGAAGA